MDGFVVFFLKGILGGEILLLNPTILGVTNPGGIRPAVICHMFLLRVQACNP